MAEEPEVPEGEVKKAPAFGELARRWEAEAFLRQRLFEDTKNYLTRWPCPKTVGVASCQAMSINSRLLELMAEVWVKHHEYPCAFPIGYLRKEARFKESFEIGVISLKTSHEGERVPAANGAERGPGFDATRRCGPESALQPWPTPLQSSEDQDTGSLRVNLSKASEFYPIDLFCSSLHPF